ncbi:MAG: phytoene/squalene synthase family protein [Janthinobacterium lividum]
MAQLELSAMGQMVRRHDPDRFFTALFAPVARREALLTLYAFNHELARAREVTREPVAALIRLQWWREVVEGARRRHEVAGPLGKALDAGQLDPADLLGMIDAREAEAGEIETLADAVAYVQGSAGGVMVAAARALGMEAAEALRPWGAAYGVVGVLRNAPVLAAQDRGFLGPAVTEEQAAQELVRLARTWLATAVRVPRRARAAMLPAVLARRRLGRDPAGFGLGDRLAVVWSALR